MSTDRAGFRLAPEVPEPNCQRMLDNFLTLVQIDSPSRQEAAVAAWCRQAFQALGCTVKVDDSAAETGSDTGNLIITWPASPGQSGRLYFSAHMDTVEPGRGIQPVVKDGIIRAAGPTILGGDDKVGIAAALEAIQTIGESGLAHPEVVLLLTTCEEIGLSGSKAMDGANFAGEPCFVLDSDGEIGGVVIGAPFHVGFTARFIGKASHAGAAPEKGISAIQMAAQAIAAMPFGRLDDSSTANIGTIQGGSADNVMAESCLVSGEFRALESERIDEIKGQIVAAFDAAVTAAGGHVEMEFRQSFHGFKLSEQDPLVQLVLAVAESVGAKPQPRYTGGGSDANIFAGKGLNPVVLSAGMADVHSLDESLAVADMEDLTRMIITIIISC